MRKVADTYGLTKSVVDRHRRECMTAKVAAVNAGRLEQIQTSDLLDGMVKLQKITLEQLDTAIEAKTKAADVARIVKEVRENIGMMGRFLGSFAGENAKSVDNRVQVLALKEMTVEQLRDLANALRSK